MQGYLPLALGQASLGKWTDTSKSWNAGLSVGGLGEASLGKRADTPKSWGAELLAAGLAWQVQAGGLTPRSPRMPGYLVLGLGSASPGKSRQVA